LAPCKHARRTARPVLAEWKQFRHLFNVTRLFFVLGVASGEQS